MWWDMCLCGCFILLDTNQSVISGLRTGDMAEYVMKRKRGSTYCAADHRGFPLGLIKSMFVLIHDNQTLCIKKLHSSVSAVMNRQSKNLLLTS